MIAVTALIAATANIENDFFQFCTTKAYGWPAPWKIEYCLCEGERTVFPLSSIIINTAMVFATGVVTFFIVCILRHKY